MRGDRMAWVAVGLLFISLATANAQTTEQIAKLPNEIEFKAPLRPDAPPGVVLYGDLTKPGMYVTRSKFPVGFKVLPHWHGEERTVVVLSGTIHVGIGEKWDESKMKAYPPGSFFTEPPKLPHFTWAKDGEVVLQVTGIGPFTTTPAARD
jgi:quercetin dioxygenase-like cupin family protein